MSGKVKLEVDEIISLIRHSNEPTVLIEGSDDVIVYRKIESMVDVSVLPTGGRVPLLEIFRRRAEFPGKKVAFIADLDFWCVTGVPDEYLNQILVFTDGYSIENEVFVDANICEMFSEDEKRIFSDELSKFNFWYSLALSRHVLDRKEVISYHPDNIFASPDAYDIFCKLRMNEVYPQEMYDIISDNPYKKIRGKSLMDLAIRQLGKKGRNVVHRNSKTFLEFAAAKPGDSLNRIFQKIKDIMG